MDLFTRDDLRALLNHAPGPCVSSFMPTTRGGGNLDKVRWKNHLKEAEERLREHGHRRSDASDWLAPGHALLDNVAFWQNMTVGGLAGFLAPGLARFYRVPMAL